MAAVLEVEIGGPVERDVEELSFKISEHFTDTYQPLNILRNREILFPHSTNKRQDEEQIKGLPKITQVPEEPCKAIGWLDAQHF